jgi:hypothetical protein
MSIYLGSQAVTLYLGAVEVASPGGAFLDGLQVFPTGAATLYFDGAVDDAWTTVGNWWLDDEHTQAAGRLPAAGDSVIATASIAASGQTVVNFTLNDPDNDDYGLFGTLTVTGTATFTGFAFLDGTGTVTGNATFNDNARNFGTVTGTATFTGNSCNDTDGTAGTFVPNPPPSC